MKTLTSGLFALVMAAISATASAESSSAKDVVQHVLSARGWNLDWRIDQDFVSPPVPVRKDFYLGAFLRDVLHPFVAINRDVAILVCEDNKTVIVFREMGAENINACKRLFNRADFEQ